MRSRRLIVLLLLALAAGCQKRHGAPGVNDHIVAPDTVSLMSYNVENLFDLVNNGTEYDEYRPGESNWTRETHDVKVANIASVIGAARPDIVALCEVENGNAVKELVTALSSQGIDYRYSALGDRPDPTPTIVAVLSRFPIVASRGYGVPEPQRSSRNILEADILVGADTLKVFANHWPSKEHDESERMTAAGVLADRISQLSPRTDYVIAGDLNADYNECETAGFSTGEERSFALNHRLKTVFSRPGQLADYVDRDRLVKAGPGCHFDLWLELPPDKRVSYVYHGRPETPDHLLLPASLFDSTGFSYVEHSFRAFTWDGRLLMNGNPYRWQFRHDGKRVTHLGQGYSDHLPIVARFFRGPFRRDSTEVPVVDKEVRKPKTFPADTIGFETGLEGWDGCGREMALSIDTSSNNHCLVIEGFPRTENLCAGRVHLPLAGFDPSTPASVRMKIRGEGRLNIRIRAPGMKWHYYNGESFAPSGAGRYAAYSFTAWKRIELPLFVDDTACRAFDVELRAGKGQRFRFMIDNVMIRQHTAT